jgi:2-polyprenyl-3-methyl-5-hydroxy-6-metoxy-1,4-benzoquinol methylase
MAEWKLFQGEVAPFTDDEFYRDREAAHHMEQDGHRDRLLKTLEYALVAQQELGRKTFSDLGCGDGGLVQAAAQRGLNVWGYDMQPANVEYAQRSRVVDVRLTNFEEDDDVAYGDCSILSEVLEHVSDPHRLVKNLPSRVIVASSPFHETDEAHYEFHNWAWDDEGYAALIEQGGYNVVRHEHAWLSQVILGVRP